MYRVVRDWTQVSAWTYGMRRCPHMLVLEDDAHFDSASLALSETRVSAFLRAEVQGWDALHLGWTWENMRSVREWDPPVEAPLAVPGLRCTYRIRHPLLTHAYIVSRRAMAEWSRWTWDRRRGRGQIDRALCCKGDRGGMYAVRPQLAFQRYHPSTNRERCPRRAWRRAHHMLITCTLAPPRAPARRCCVRSSMWRAAMQATAPR